MLFCPTCRIALGETQSTCPRDGHTGLEIAVPPIPPDLARRFQVIEVFASGSTGVSYLVEEPEAQRRGLLKILHADVTSALPERQRIARELAKQSTIELPLLVVPLATGEAGGVTWVLRPWIEGVSLRARLARSGPLSVSETTAVATSLASALDGLHRAGLLHRDLNPSHVLLVTHEGSTAVRLIDAGIAARVQATSVFTIAGSAPYISPEQTQGKLVSFRSDLYALGCVIFEMLMGQPPFGREDADVLLAAHASEAPPSLPDNVPAALSALILSLLAKDPKNRPFSAQQVVRALESFAADPNAPSKVEAMSSNPPPSSPPAQGSAPPAPRTSKPPPVPGRASSLPPPVSGRAGSMPPPVPAEARRSPIKATMLGMAPVIPEPPRPSTPPPVPLAAQGPVIATIIEESPRPAHKATMLGMAPVSQDDVPTGDFAPIDDSTANAALAAQAQQATLGQSVIEDFDEKPTAIQQSSPGEIAAPMGAFAAPTDMKTDPAFLPGVAVAHPKKSGGPALWIFGGLGAGAAIAGVIVLVASLTSGGSSAASADPTTQPEAPATPESAAEVATGKPSAPQVEPAPVAQPAAVAAKPSAPPAAPAPAPAVQVAAANKPSAPVADAPQPAPAPQRVAAPPSPAPARAAASTSTASSASTSAPPAASTRSSARPTTATATPAAAAPAAAPAPAADPAAALREEARAHYAARRFREAATAYERAAALAPSDSGIFAGLGRSRLELNDATGAAAAYRKAVQLAPSNAGFFVGLGRAYFLAGDRAQAERALRHALELDPNNRAAQQGLDAVSR